MTYHRSPLQSFTAWPGSDDSVRKQPIRPEVIDLCELVADLERMLVRVIGEDVDFRVHVGQERCRVKADRAQLEQLIVNLVVNSRDALPRGAPRRSPTGSFALP